MEGEKFCLRENRLSVFEVACLRLMQKKISNCTPEHSKAFLYIMNCSFYKSLEEISLALNLRSNKTEKIVDLLARKKLIEKSGCLCRQKTIEEIAKILQ